MLHKQLKKARLEAGLTMEDAGQRLGVSQSTLSRIEAGDTGVSSQRLVNLASAYCVSPSALLEGSVVRSMSETDLDRMGMVIEFIEVALTDKNPRPSPRQIKDAVVTIFKQETALSWDTGATFDPSRYQDLVKLLFEQASNS